MMLSARLGFAVASLAAFSTRLPSQSTPALPFAVGERLVYDGHGGVLTPAVAVSITGTIIQPPQGSPGVYTVEADCTGTLTFADGPMFKLHVRPDGRSLNMLQTNPNTVMQGTALKVLPLSAWAG